MTQTVPEILREGADTYETRNAIYGSTYLIHGQVAAALFPNGVVLNTPEDHVRFGLVTMQIGKLTRYAQNFAHGGHADSNHDLMVYTAMLSEVDGAIAANVSYPFPGADRLEHNRKEVLGGDTGRTERPKPFQEPVPMPADAGRAVPAETSFDEDELARILAGETADAEPPMVIPEPTVQK